jgi:thiol-disulfide isomerase/thioredoxin
MKRLLVAVLAALIALSVDPARAVSGMEKFTRAEELQPAPDVEFTDLSGAPAKLSDFRGKVVLVNLWATWCTPCVAEMPSLVKLQREMGTRDFVILALSSDRGGARVVEPFIKEHKLGSLAVFLDPKGIATRSLGARALPTSILLDRQGREVGRLRGTADWASREAIELVRSLFSGTERADLSR